MKIKAVVTKEITIDYTPESEEIQRALEWMGLDRVPVTQQEVDYMNTTFGLCDILADQICKHEDGILTVDAFFTENNVCLCEY